MANRSAVRGAKPGPRPADGAARPAAGWPLAAAVVGLGGAGLIALFWSTAAAMVETWVTSSAFGHAFLIPLVSAYLIWRRRAALAAAAPRPWFWGLAPAAGIALLWLLGDLGNAQVVEQFALIALIQVLAVTVLGLAAVRAILFPLFYLYFAVPFGSFLIPPLQDFTAQFLVRALRLTGIPVHLDGIFLYIPSGAFEVAEACAGARFLIASVALGVLVAHVMYRQAWRRALFVGLSILVPIAANGLRAYVIVMLAHLSDYRIAVSADHVTYGLIFLSIVIFCLLGLGMTFREPGAAPALERPAPALPGPGPAPAAGLLAAACALGLAAAAAGYGGLIEARAAGGAPAALAAPAVRPPWTPSPAPGAPPWRPQFAGADLELAQSYGAGGRTVDLHIAYYGRQRQGAEVVGRGNRLADGTQWERAESGRAEARLAGQPAAVTQTRLKAPDETGRIVWSWYWVDGRLVANPYLAKLLQVRAKLLGGVQAAAVVSVASAYRDAPAEATEALQDFLDHVEPLDRALARAGGS